MSADFTTTPAWLSGESALDHIAALSAELEACRNEIGTLKLQLDILSTTDSITGLPNVHGVVELMEDAGARLARTGEHYALMMIRIPELEAIHGRGDIDSYREAVRHSAALIVAALRQVDKVGRVDRSTFIATLPSLTGAGVEGVVERLSRLLHSVPLAFPDHDVVRLRPEIAVVLSQDEGSTEVPMLLAVLYDARENATFDFPVVIVAPPANRPYEIHLT